MNASVPYAFLKKDLLTELSYKLHFVMQAAGIFFASLTFFFLAKLVAPNMNRHLEPYGGDYFSFVLVGFAFSNYLQVSTQSFGASIRDAQLMGIMEMLLVSGTRLTTIVLSSALYKFIITSLHVLLFLLFGMAVFSMDLARANYPAALLLLLLTIASFSCIGILSASFVVVFKKGDPIAWVVTSLSWLIGGVYYPISVLPDWLQKLSYLLPIRYALEGMRLALLQGYSLQQLLPNLAGLAIFSAVMLPFSLSCFHRAIAKARIDGTLTQY